MGQQVSTFDSIDTKRRGDPSQCFRQVLKEWLKGVNPPPTWQAMVNALKSHTVAQHQVAEQIEIELSPALSMQPHHLSLQSASPQLVALSCRIRASYYSVDLAAAEGIGPFLKLSQLNAVKTLIFQFTNFSVNMCDYGIC